MRLQQQQPNLDENPMQWLPYGYLLTSACAAAWAPLIGFILLERKNRFSISQWGPALMGFTDATRYLVLFAAFIALYIGIVSQKFDGDITGLTRVYQARRCATKAWVSAWQDLICWGWNRVYLKAKLSSLGSWHSGKPRDPHSINFYAALMRGLRKLVTLMVGWLSACNSAVPVDLVSVGRQNGAFALMVLATWLLMWFNGSGLLSAHYTHFRLRLRSQLSLLLLHRRAWLVVTAIVAIDSFCISLNTSYVLPAARRAQPTPTRSPLSMARLLMLRTSRPCVEVITAHCREPPCPSHQLWLILVNQHC